MRCFIVTLVAARTLSSEKSLREDSKNSGSKDISWDDLASDVKNINERAEASLADLDSNSAAPSSLLEESSAKPQSFASVQSRLAKLQSESENNINQLANVMAMPAPPTSLIETDGTAKLSKNEMDAKVSEWVKELQDMGKVDDTPAEPLDLDSLEKKISALELRNGKHPSLIQTSSKVPTLAEIGSKIDELGAQLHGGAAPASFIQIESKLTKHLNEHLMKLGEPNKPSPALLQLEQKLKALNQKMQAKKAKMDAEAAKLVSESGGAIPASFAEVGVTTGALSHEDSELDSMNLLKIAQNSDHVKKFNNDVDSKFDALRTRLHAISKASQAEINDIPSSFAETDSEHVSTWEENAAAVAKEAKELQDFTAHTNAQIAALRDGHHSVASALQLGAAESAGEAVEEAAASAR